MLTTEAYVRTIPQLSNIPAVPVAYLNRLIGGASLAIKRYCKRELEIRSYKEYVNGPETLDIVIGAWPIWQAQTTISGGSNGVALPVSTINVTSTLGFCPGIFSDTSLLPPTIAVQTANNTWTNITYTSATATSFTGCTGGSGVLYAGNYVATPVVWVDANGNAGQNPSGFGPGTQLVQGIDYLVNIDNAQGQASHAYAAQGGRSQRGTLRRIAGAGGGGSWINFLPDSLYRGKLAAFRMPTWPRGFGNIRCMYSAGYYPIPDDLQMACAMLVSQMVRIIPNGVNMSSESLGGYSYSALYSADNPELGDVRRLLASYRETSFGPAL